jgi:hypothetical protein
MDSFNQPLHQEHAVGRARRTVVLTRPDATTTVQQETSDNNNNNNNNTPCVDFVVLGEKATAKDTPPAGRANQSD